MVREKRVATLVYLHASRLMVLSSACLPYIARTNCYCNFQRLYTCIVPITSASRSRPVRPSGLMTG